MALGGFFCASLGAGGASSAEASDGSRKEHESKRSGVGADNSLRRPERAGSCDDAESSDASRRASNAEGERRRKGRSEASKNSRDKHCDCSDDCAEGDGSDCRGHNCICANKGRAVACSGASKVGCAESDSDDGCKDGDRCCDAAEDKQVEGWNSRAASDEGSGGHTCGPCGSDAACVDRGVAGGKKHGWSADAGSVDCEGAQKGLHPEGRGGKRRPCDGSGCDGESSARNKRRGCVAKCKQREQRRVGRDRARCHEQQPGCKGGASGVVRGSRCRGWRQHGCKEGSDASGDARQCKHRNHHACNHEAADLSNACRSSFSLPVLSSSTTFAFFFFFFVAALCRLRCQWLCRGVSFSFSSVSMAASSRRLLADASENRDANRKRGESGRNKKAGADGSRVSGSDCADCTHNNNTSIIDHHASAF